jgi:hypothetical protein
MSAYHCPSIDRIDVGKAAKQNRLAGGTIHANRCGNDFFCSDGLRPPKFI